MKNVPIKKPDRNGKMYSIATLIILFILVYLLVSFYFANHTFFRTSINGVDVSLKAHDELDDTMRNFVKNYKLQLIERSGETESIAGIEIGYKYNDNNSILKIIKAQNPICWIGSFFKARNYCIDGVFLFNEALLEDRINKLNCINRAVTEPENVSFRYQDGTYVIVEEIYGDSIDIDKLYEAIESSILKGITTMDLNEWDCYKNPDYTLKSAKTPETKKLLDKYVSSKITYLFGDEREVLDGNRINHWLSVDENLDVVINHKLVYEYVKELSKKYDTVGVAREFKTSVNKIMEIKGGFYGWKINRAAETMALMENIKLGETVEKEPIYSQKAQSRDKNDIGNTYVEINITRQHLWFYKNGKLIAQGDIVTGNPAKGNATSCGIYMLNYKDKDATLRGHDYEAEVTYWMPFNGNIGIHDASWRHSFGGSIYKRNGTHGCVNTPLYLAKKIYENIEDGTPIICYEEEKK